MPRCLSVTLSTPRIVPVKISAAPRFLPINYYLSTIKATTSENLTGRNFGAAIFTGTILGAERFTDKNFGVENFTG